MSQHWLRFAAPPQPRLCVIPYRRLSDTGRIAKRIHSLPIDRKIYLQHITTYYQPLHRGDIVAVRKRVWTTRKGEQKEAWIADYTDGTGKRHIQTFAQKKKADAYAAKVKVDVNAGTHVVPDSN